MVLFFFIYIYDELYTLYLIDIKIAMKGNINCKGGDIRHELTMNERARTAKPSLIVMAAVTRVGAD